MSNVTAVKLNSGYFDVVCAGANNAFAAQRDRRKIVCIKNRAKMEEKKTSEKIPKAFYLLAQRRGFEPPVRFRRTHDFQSCSLNHSDISANSTLS